jgi:hypothetical protein
MMTRYVLLFKDGTSDDYGVLAKRYEAASNVSAIRAAAADVQKPGTYVAIPERSFETIVIEIDTDPRVKVVKAS